MKKIILCLLILFLFGCSIDPNFTSPITGHVHIDALNTLQKIIVMTGDQYGYTCERGLSDSQGDTGTTYFREYHLDISPNATTAIILDATDYCDAIRIQIEHYYGDFIDTSYIDPNESNSNRDFLYDLINNLLVDELSLEQLSDFIDPTNTKYVITDQEILDINHTDLYKLVHFNDTNPEHYMDIAYYDSGYDLTYVGYVLLDSSACE